MHVELVSHCYHYAQLLRYQLSSLVLWPPQKIEVTATVCFTPDDIETRNVLGEFSARSIPRVRWNWRPMDARRLCRRSIGRNEAALASTADWIWFCDVDHCFGEKCWEAFEELRTAPPILVFPRWVQLQKSHAYGDACIAAARQRGGLVQIDVAEFTPVRMRFALGGIQILHGDAARRTGYLRASKRFQRVPRKPLFQRCREDVAFRRSLGTLGVGVPIAEVYRIRHTKTGRSDPEARL